MKVMDMKVIEILVRFGNYAEHNPLNGHNGIFSACDTQKTHRQLKRILLGFVFAILGLHLFLKGTNHEPFATRAPSKKHTHTERRWLIVMLAFVIGYLGIGRTGLKAWH